MSKRKHGAWISKFDWKPSDSFRRNIMLYVLRRKWRFYCRYEIINRREAIKSGWNTSRHNTFGVESGYRSKSSTTGENLMTGGLFRLSESNEWGKKRERGRERKKDSESNISRNRNYYNTPHLVRVMGVDGAPWWRAISCIFLLDHYWSEPGRSRKKEKREKARQRGEGVGTRRRY